jgi:hypothetical protein
LNDKLDSCHYRIIGGQKLYNEKANIFHAIELEKKYNMKAQVALYGDSSIYHAKFWKDGTLESIDWDIKSIEGSFDIQNGSVLLIAHNTDVTFGNIKVIHK